MDRAGGTRTRINAERDYEGAVFARRHEPQEKRAVEARADRLKGALRQREIEPDGARSCRGNAQQHPTQWLVPYAPRARNRPHRWIVPAHDDDVVGRWPWINSAQQPPL